ncbi:hypothetical protein K1719_043059 [Acacia pycnantha]|nr:hypothetical protein K1719_043059 [Acacia pycnantha]
MIRKMIKVDRSTSIYDKGGFARICVEIDLKKPLTPTYTVFGEERNIIYEGLHNVCFTCGMYGHQKSACPTTEDQRTTSGQDQSKPDAGPAGVDVTAKETIPEAGTDGGVRLDKERCDGSSGDQKAVSNPDSGGGSLVTGGDESDESPFGKIRILRRDFRGQANQAKLRKGMNDNKDQDMRKNQLEDQRDLRTVIKNKEVAQGLNECKKELTKSKGPLMPEWVQVGAKRKNLGKGKAKGKENKPPAVRAYRKKLVGHGLDPTIANSFSVLHELEAQGKEADRPHGEKPKDEMEKVPQDVDTVMLQPGINVTHSGGDLGDLMDNNLNVIMGPTQYCQLEQNSVTQDIALGKAATPQHTPSISQ